MVFLGLSWCRVRLVGFGFWSRGLVASFAGRPLVLFRSFVLWMLAVGRMVSLSSGFGVDVAGVLGGLVLRNPFSALGSSGLAQPLS